MQSVEQVLSFERDAGSTHVGHPSSDGRLGLAQNWMADESWTSSYFLFSL